MVIGRRRVVQILVAAIPRTAERPMEATVITARVTRMAIMAMAAVREVLMEEVSAAAAIVVAVGTAAAGEVMVVVVAAVMAAANMNQDEEQLRLLTIFHYVLAGLAGLFSLFPVIHLTLGLVILLFPHQLANHAAGAHESPPAFLGWLLVSVAGFFILSGLTLAGFILATARKLSKRRSHTFCMVLACVECVFLPLGTMLGIFTIIVLNRSSVRQLFAAN